MLNQKTQEQLKNSLKRLLKDTLNWIEEEQNTLLQDSPYASASDGEIRLFAALRGESRSISELSRYLGVSRQAVHQTVHKLHERGVVDLEYAVNNQRDKLVVISEQGREVQKTTAEHFQIIEKKIATNIGRKNMELIRQLLKENLEKANDTNDQTRGN